MMRVLTYGEAALLAELDEPAAVPGARDAIAALDGVIEAIAGAATVLAVVDPAALDQVRVALTGIEPTAAVRPDRDPVEVPVVYDGADLADVAAETGLSVEEVIARHAAGGYVVRFCGFAPGFAYLDGLDPGLHVARRSEPRTAVPAGSVAVAGEFTGVYPHPSPGGWRLLGHTDAPLWDVTRDPPALLGPGTPVRFVRS
jgi:KipI family sensor histidine kinase inhibitor